MATLDMGNIRMLPLLVVVLSTLAPTNLSQILSFKIGWKNFANLLIVRLENSERAGRVRVLVLILLALIDLVPMGLVV